MLVIRNVFAVLAVIFVFPILSAAQPGLIPYSPDPTNDITPTLFWSEVSSATNYRIQIDNDESFTSPLVDGDDIGTFTNFTAPPLQDGDIYWRVANDPDYVYSTADHFVIDTMAPSLTIDTPASPTSQDGQVITGTMEIGAIVAVSSSGSQGSVTYPDQDRWSCTLTGFVDGTNTIIVTATDAASNTATQTESIEYDPPTLTLTISPVVSPSVVNSQTIAGTIEEGAEITSVELDTTAVAGTVDYPTATTWSCLITGLVTGSNNITVTAQNAAMNTATRTATIEYDTSPVATIELIPYTPDPTNLISPTLMWREVSNASNYRIQIDDENSFASPIVDGENTGMATSYTVSLPEGNVYWRVAANTDDYVYSDYDSFFIDRTPPSLTLDAVSSPTETAVQTISGSMEAGSTVTIDSSATPGAVTYPSPTEWNCEISGFSQGLNSITVTATDAAGNTAEESTDIDYQPVQPFTLTIDTVDSPTNVDSQTITGTKNETATITLVDVDTSAVAGPVTYPSPETWSCTITGLVEGANNITVTAQDASETATATGTIIFDTAIPALTINPVVSPTDVDSQTITGTVESGATVEVATDTSATAGLIEYPASDTWSCTITGLTVGINNITVTATNAAQNTAQETTFLEYQPSDLTLTLDQVSTPTSVNSQTISGTADEAAVVTVSVDTAATVGIVSRAGTAWVCEIANLAEGPNIITVEASLGLESTTRTSTITYDTTAPIFSIDAIITPTNSDSQTVSGSMEAGATVAASVNTSATVGAVSYPSPTTWSFDVTNLASGDNGITVYASDDLGNTSSGAVTIHYSTLAPTVSIDPVITPTNSPEQMIYGDRKSDATIEVIVFGGNASFISYPTADRWSCTISNMNEGANDIEVTVTDGSNNTATATATITLDTVPPDVTIDTVSTPTNLNSQIIGGTMEEGATVTVTATPASVSAVSYPSSTTWTCQISGIVTEGVYNAVAVATDAAGNTGSAVAPIVYDRTPPSLSIDALPLWTNLNYLTLTGNRSTDGIITVSADTSATMGIPAYPTGTSWSCQVGNLEERLNVFTVTATDAAGNSISGEVSTTYDGTPPFLSVNAVTTPTNVSAQTVCGERENGLPVVINWPGFISYQSDSAWCCDVSGFVEGNNMVAVSITDYANNTTTASVNIIYDATPPTVSIYPVDSPTNVDTQSVEGSMEYGAQIEVVPDTLAVVNDLVFDGISWSCTIADMEERNNVIYVTATDAAGNTAVDSATIEYDATPPEVTINPVTSPTITNIQTLSGTMESQAKISLSADTNVMFESVEHDTDTTWSCVVRYLQQVDNTITVTAMDGAGNEETATALVKYYEVYPGDVNNDTFVNLTDAIMALKVCAGISDSGTDVRADLDGDGKIGLLEAVYALQSSAGLR